MHINVQSCLIAGDTKDGQGFFAQFDPSKVDIFYPLGPGN